MFPPRAHHAVFFAVVELLDEFAFRFYQELDYNLECENGLRIAKDMSVLPMVVIPKNYPEYTSRRVHVAEWIDGEKLSQSTADDVGALVNLGVITYLTQLLDKGFFHADPHPGNMMRTTDGKLAILDFGLVSNLSDESHHFPNFQLTKSVDDGGHGKPEVRYGGSHCPLAESRLH